eukprot:scaffold8136_cov127-Cylindrotheca_fusiformis.AAC.22
MAEIEKSLRDSFPDATDAEIARFVAGYGRGNVEKNRSVIEKRLSAYMAWRKHNELDDNVEKTFSSDSDAWSYAVKKAWDIQAEPVGKGKKEGGAESTDVATENSTEGKEQSGAQQGDKPDLDQVVFFHKSKVDGKPICDVNGNRVLHLLSGIIDPNLAPAKVYADSIAVYLDINFDRNSDEKVTILVDVRAGQGWPNTPAYRMVSFVKTIIKTFEFNFPERVKKFVAFPIPIIAVGIFNTIKLLFDSNTAEKIVLVSGSAAVDAALPKEGLKVHISESVLDETEEARLSHFKPVAESAGSSWFSFG